MRDYRCAGCGRLIDSGGLICCPYCGTSKDSDRLAGIMYMDDGCTHDYSDDIYE